MHLNSHIVASYLSVVAHALSALTSLSEHESRPRVSLVLMDSKLDSLSLPVLRPSIHAPEAELGGQSNPPYRVGCLVDHYFEWVGTFQSKDSTSPGPLTQTLHLSETGRGDDREDVILLWKRIDGHGRVFNDRSGVTYTWQ